MGSVINFRKSITYLKKKSCLKNYYEYQFNFQVVKTVPEEQLAAESKKPRQNRLVSLILHPLFAPLNTSLDKKEVGVSH